MRRSFVNMALLIILILSCYSSAQLLHHYGGASAFSTHHPIEQVVDMRDRLSQQPYVSSSPLESSINPHEENHLHTNNYAKHLTDEALCSSSDRQEIGLTYQKEVARKESEEEEEEEEQKHEHEGRRKQHDREHEYDHESFVLEKPIKVIKTEAGELHVLPHGGINSELGRKRIGLGFLSLEPKALLLPQYIDAHCLFLVHKGRGQLSWVDNGDLREADLEEGDVFKIDSGTVFHVYNVDEGQRLSIFSVYDTSAVFSDGIFHSFFVGGGQTPKTVLSGFDENVLAKAFKASNDEVHDVLSSQTRGPIIYSVQRNESKKVSGLGKSVTKMLDKYIGLPSIFPKDKGEKPYNLFKKKADFSNDYGSTAAIDGDDFKLLKDVDKGVFLVRLKAGAVLGPHWNPRATEIALVTKGEGEIQIVYPNGTAAATEQVREGSVFYVPQNFPMCQIASRSGPFEFMGFTTSSRPTHPHFLAGSNSVLKTLDTQVLASAFNLPSEHLQKFLDEQSEAVILPSDEPLPPALLVSSPRGTNRKTYF